MVYLNAAKISGIALVVFIIAVIFIPVAERPEDIGIILTISTFLFAIIAGFFLARLNSRYGAIRINIADEDSNFISFYKASAIYGKKIQVKIGNIIDNYYLIVSDYVNSPKYYQASAKVFFQLYDVLKAIKKSSLKKGLQDTYDDLIVQLGNIEKNRNRSSEFMGSRLAPGQWIVISTLALIIIFSIFMMRTGSLYWQVMSAVFSSVVILIIFLMRDLQNLRLGKKYILEETGQEVFDFIGKKRYYNQEFLKNGWNKVPHNVKEYRLGLHKPGEKQKIKIVNNPNYKG